MIEIPYQEQFLMIKNWAKLSILFRKNYFKNKWFWEIIIKVRIRVKQSMRISPDIPLTDHACAGMKIL